MAARSTRHSSRPLISWRRLCRWVYSPAASAILSMRNYGANRQMSPGQWYFPMPAHCRGTRPSCMRHSWKGLCLFIILWWFSTRPRPLMAVSALFLLCYGLFRFAVEFMREPDAHLGYLGFGWLTMGQVLSFPMILIGIVLCVLAHARYLGSE